MFGHHKAKRESRRKKRAEEAENLKQKEYEAGAPERERLAEEIKKTKVEEKSAQSAADRKKSYEEGRERIKSLYSDPTIEGIPEKERNAIKYEANKNIHRSMNSANRKLLGSQSQHGIQGQGGVGFAQQQELQRLAQEGYGGVERDVNSLNEKRRMQNIAAIFAGEQGEASQSQLDKQMAADELDLADEKRRQRMFEDQFYKQFSRV